jgi:vacuolar-type H+-ATPase subunit E/Vma4
MSLEKILEKIIDDAQAEADKIILESKKKAAENKEKARKEASDLAEALVKEAEKAFQRGAKGKERLKRKIIMKEGESEEPYDEEKLKEELRSRLENEILEALKI